MDIILTQLISTVTSEKPHTELCFSRLVNILCYGAGLVWTLFGPPPLPHRIMVIHKATVLAMTASDMDPVRASGMAESYLGPCSQMQYDQVIGKG